MIKEAIYKLTNKENLSYEMAEGVMDEIMSGEASGIHMGAYLTGLRMKGETIDEISASAAGMRKHCTRLLHNMDVLEIVGTGGDEAFTFNISTTAALVVSATGIPVAKHGNRSVSSKCGAADVLEALGVNIMISPAQSAEILKEIGLCFMFAQTYHTAMKYVAPVRRELGIRTIFNILGPLANPAGANMQLLGVYDETLVEPLAKVLANLGVKRAMVVYGKDGLDEISLSAPTVCCEIRDGKLTSYVLEPEQLGLTRCYNNDLTGGGPLENAEITKAILRGEKGPKRDAVLLNAAASIYIVKDNITLKEALALAKEAIDSNRAALQLEQFVKLTNQLKNE
ncbi:anthranilate phosphoribosyltransferase [Anaerocolumna cellulosilytica]|uniref:Anthranilate phosphoribosyltransferase n=1 Tax=Anaerocolumna cellulosilytica TaxID=433286 RepID=A0A6S6R6I9_9FIRM|nr:anthranilate phosphoribosyltransferase [Anaerocolumna cellulosilytica]MBB5194160.1 anthranilate phosphoribosyltransferase [Anaerocolumna cellulosilytica]BCJ94628.1 anthranilate phosphoribosyltransferase [Anaerocolumna cellulosilytica]